MYKRILALFCVGLLLLGTTSCSGGKAVNTNSSAKGTLKISFFKGGLGEEWLKAIAAKFEEANPGVKVVLDGDPGLTEKMGPRLESGANLPDLAFVLQTNWQIWAIKGYLEDLTDVYNSEIDNGKKLIDKLQPGDANYGLIQGKYWVVPWTDGATSLVYNAKMFEDNGWKVPSTVQELFVLMPKIKAKGIAPFAWGGKVITYWDFIARGWWAQYEGEEGIGTFKKMAGPEVYAQEGRLKALEIFEKIIKDKTNSIEGAAGMDHIQSQMAFVQGKAAMIPNGGWIENEMKNSTPEGFRMKMMPLPVIDGAKDKNINNTQAGDFIMIPKNAKNVELAKEFLKFSSRDDMLDLFTQKSGSVRPFKYDPSKLEGLSEFSKSVIDIWKNSRNIYFYSDNPIYYNKFYDWPMTGAPYGMIMVGDETAQSSFSSNVQFAKANWEAAKKEMGIK